MAGTVRASILVAALALALSGTGLVKAQAPHVQTWRHAILRFTTLTLSPNPIVSFASSDETVTGNSWPDLATKLTGRTNFADPAAALTGVLDAIGAKGWELVSVTTEGRDGNIMTTRDTYYFKRQGT